MQKEKQGNPIYTEAEISPERKAYLLKASERGLKQYKEKKLNPMLNKKQRGLKVVKAVCYSLSETPATVEGKECDVFIGKKAKTPVHADVSVSGCDIRFSDRGKYPVNYNYKGNLAIRTKDMPTQEGRYESAGAVAPAHPMCDVVLKAGKEKVKYNARNVYLSSEKKGIK